MSTVSAEVEDVSDAELIAEVRSGDSAAYGALYQRHVTSAYHLAYQLSRSRAEADDLVSEAFAKVLETLRAGRGPDSAFRAYLLTTLRHTAYDRTRSDRRVELSGDVSTMSGVSATAVSVPFSDTVVAGLERSLAARAFATLPERWQAVLWHTEIEGQTPAEVAPLLGLVPNGVSALAYRAREGLRQAYLQAHLSEITDLRCRAIADRLGAWTRGGLSKREKAQIELHLDRCDRCRDLAAELADVNGELRAVVAPLVLGTGAVGYLATATKEVATVGVGMGTAHAATAGAVAVHASAGIVGGAVASLPGVAAGAAALAASVALGVAQEPDEHAISEDIRAVAPAPAGAFPIADTPPPNQAHLAASDVIDPRDPGPPGATATDRDVADALDLTVVTTAGTAVHVAATNTGTSTRPLTLTVRRPPDAQVSAAGAVDCSGPVAYTCTTSGAVPPGWAVRLTIDRSDRFASDCSGGPARVTGRLGAARQELTIDLPCPARAPSTPRRADAEPSAPTSPASTPPPARPDRQPSTGTPREQSGPPCTTPSASPRREPTVVPTTPTPPSSTDAQVSITGEDVPSHPHIAGQFVDCGCDSRR